MWIVRLALRRTYTFVVLAVLITVLGFVSINRMATDIFPEINIPVVSVVWQFTGMPADEVETRIVLINERVLTASVNHIEHIAVSSDTLTEQQIFDYAQNFIIQQLGTVFARTAPSVVIPSEALATRTGGPRVGTLDDQQRVRYRTVELGRDYGAEVEVLAGLKAGETVVVHPGDDLAEGTVVEPVPVKH